MQHPHEPHIGREWSHCTRPQPCQTHRCSAIIAIAVLLSLGAIPDLSAQMQAAREAPAAREALGARIDSLAAEHKTYIREIHVRDSLRAEYNARLRTDTMLIGPFLLVSHTPASDDVVAAIRDEWAARTAMVGPAVSRLDGVVIGLNVGTHVIRGLAGTKVYDFSVWGANGRADYRRAAERVITSALTDALPEDMRNWLDGGSLGTRDAHRWAYRHLATSNLPQAQRCFAREPQSCAAALMGTHASGVSAHTRSSLLQHALDLGGDGSYARLIEDASDASARLANAAGRPINDVVLSWRATIQDARPNVNASVARAGFWTLIWLAGLALLAMRSTRWRLG
ncbi:MAG: hypothetical protein KFH98_14275 [Gemmatimonadetes bacterium]|nr:hypothetical protein [Gemmatimonadota bacterium]